MNRKGMRCLCTFRIVARSASDAAVAADLFISIVVIAGKICCGQMQRSQLPYTRPGRALQIPPARHSHVQARLRFQIEGLGVRGADIVALCEPSKEGIQRDQGALWNYQTRIWRAPCSCNDR